MFLVSRAVAAAIRTPTIAPLESATQEIVKDAIRENLRHSGLLPPAGNMPDPDDTPTDNFPPHQAPGGNLPQDALAVLPNKKDKNAEDAKEKAAAAANPKGLRKSAGPLGNPSAKTEGSAKRRGKLGLNSDTRAADENMNGADDGDDEF